MCSGCGLGNCLSRKPAAVLHAHMYAVCQKVFLCMGVCVKDLALSPAHTVTCHAGVDRARSSGRSGSEFGRTWLQQAGRCADSSFVSGI